MKVKILHKFHDKADYTKVYLVGETVTFDDARAEHLVSLGLVEAEAAEPKVEKVVKPVTTRRRSAPKDNQ